MLTAMFARFPNLPATDRTGSPRTEGAADGAARETASEGDGDVPDGKPHDMAGHGARLLDWHSLRARLSAERDLRGAMRGENEAMAGWIRAEGSFDPRAAEALFGHGHVDQNPAYSTIYGSGHASSSWPDDKNSGLSGSRLPDPKPSRSNDGSGCSRPISGGGSASGMNIED